MAEKPNTKDAFQADVKRVYDSIENDPAKEAQKLAIMKHDSKFFQKRKKTKKK